MIMLFNFGAESVVSSKNSYSLTLRNRLLKANIRYSRVFDLKRRVAEVFAHGASDEDLIKDTYELSLICSGYQLGKGFRNLYDYDFHMAEIEAKNNYKNDFLSKEQAEIFLYVFRAMRFSASHLFMIETAQEAKRKAIIEKAGMVYSRRVYQDFTESDKLFGDVTHGNFCDDIELDEAINMLLLKQG